MTWIGLVRGADTALNAQDKSRILLDSLRAVEPEKLFASIKVLLQKTIGDTAQTQASIGALVKLSLSPEGGWLLKSQMLALTQSGSNVMQVRTAMAMSMPATNHEDYSFL